MMKSRAIDGDDDDLNAGEAVLVSMSDPFVIVVDFILFLICFLQQ